MRCEVCKIEILIDRKRTAAERIKEQLRRQSDPEGRGRAAPRGVSGVTDSGARVRVPGSGSPKQTKSSSSEKTTPHVGFIQEGKFCLTIQRM